MLFVNSSEALPSLLHLISANLYPMSIEKLERPERLDADKILALKSLFPTAFEEGAYASEI